MKKGDKVKWEQDGLTGTGEYVKYNKKWSQHLIFRDDGQGWEWDSSRKTNEPEMEVSIGQKNCYYVARVELIQSETKINKNMNKLTPKIAQRLHPDLHEQYRAGLVDEIGGLTSEGEEARTVLVTADYLVKMNKVAEGIIKESKKEEKEEK